MRVIQTLKYMYISGGDSMRWIIEQIKYLIITILVITPLGLANTFFQMYLYEH